MARYKHIDTNPRFLAVDLQRQLLPGTFEHAMNHLIDNALDLSRFDARFKNNVTGAAAYPPNLHAKEVHRITRLESDAAQMRQWLADNKEDRKGSKGTLRKSNCTDNESAKMATNKGVIQGYTGVAAVDTRHQIIIEAQAHGTGSEQELLIPVVTAMKAVMSAAHTSPPMPATTVKPTSRNWRH